MPGSKDYLGLMLTESTVQAIHMRLTGPAFELVRAVKRDIRGVPEEDLTGVVLDVAGELKVKNPFVVSVIPSNVVTTKNIEIPSVDAEEIKSIINLQAGRHTPYSREEIILDFINIGVYNRNYSKILLIIAHHAVLKKQISLFENAGLKVRKVLFAPECVARFYGKHLKLSQEPNPVGIIEVGHDFTEFIVEFHSSVIACRNIPIGLTHLAAEGQGAKDRLMAELKKSVESYQNEDIEKLPDNYILSVSDPNLSKEFQGLLRGVLGANVNVVHYLEHVKVSPTVKESLVQIQDHLFQSAVAAVTTLNEAKLDLLPEDVRMQRAIEDQGREVTRAGILMFVLLILFCAGFFVKIHFKSTLLEQVRAENEPKRNEAELLEKVTHRTSLMKDYFRRRMGSLEILNELFNLIPDEIYLENVTWDNDGKITIQGIPESMSQVFTLVGTLEDSELFKGVKTTSTTAKKERGKDVAAFELTFRLESDQTVEAPVAKAEAPEEQSQGQEQPPSAKP